MPTQIPYDRSKAAAYAEKWAFSRNPRYISFDGMGGDCTSFVSQCLYAGTGVMNFTRDTGWYYNSASDRAAAPEGQRGSETFSSPERIQPHRLPERRRTHSLRERIVLQKFFHEPADQRKLLFQLTFHKSHLF